MKDYNDFYMHNLISHNFNENMWYLKPEYVF